MRYLLAVLLLLTPGSAFALKISARLTASLHSWESRDRSGTAVAYNTIHQLLSLDVSGLGVRGLSFHAYGRGFVHTAGSERSRRLALYSAYADWNRIAGRLDLRLGRQRVSAGVGRGTVDGTRAVVSLPYSIKLLAYAGIVAPEDRSTDVGSWRRGHACGLRVAARKFKTTVSLSLAEESRALSGVAEVNLDGDGPTVPALHTRLVGVNARTTYFPGTDVSGALELDAITWEPARLRLTGRRQATPGLRLSGSVDHRRAVAAAETVSIDPAYKPGTEVRGTATHSLDGGLQLAGAYSVVLSGDGRTHRVRFDLSRGYSKLSYHRRSGYGGRADGVSAGGRVAIVSHVSLRGSLSLSSYGLSEARRSRWTALEGVVALDVEHTGKFAASLEGRLLDNKTYDYDVQLFAKITWWIDVRR
jgi:hypothetical protein